MTSQFDHLKICLVGPIAPPAGGMANLTAQLANLLQQHGAQVELVAMNPPYKPAVIQNIPILRALFRLLPYLSQLYLAFGRNQVIHLMANSGWAWHLFAAPAIWIAKWRGVPIIINYHGGLADEFFRSQWRYVNWTLRYSSKVIVPSVFLQRLFNRYQIDAEIIPNILDHTIFYPPSTTVEHSSNSLTAPHIIITRNLEAIYDIATAIRAFAAIKTQHAGATLTIAGSGPELAKLQQLTQQLDIAQAVHFTGRLTQIQMANLYRTASLMLNSSLVDNTPGSIIEALASKVPVVSTNVGGIPQLVTDEIDALLAAPGDANALAAAALQILNNKQLSSRLKTAGFENSKKFLWSAVSIKLAKCYLTAITAKKA